MSDLSRPVEFIGIKEVIRITSLSKPVVYRMIRAEHFPRQVPLSPRRVGWLRSEVEAWTRARADEARQAA